MISGEHQWSEELIGRGGVGELVTQRHRQATQPGFFVATRTAAEGQFIDVLFRQIRTISPVTWLQIKTKFLPGFDFAFFTFSWISWSNE